MPRSVEAWSPRTCAMIDCTVRFFGVMSTYQFALWPEVTHRTAWMPPRVTRMAPWSRSVRKLPPKSGERVVGMRTPAQEHPALLARRGPSPAKREPIQAIDPVVLRRSEGGEAGLT